MVTRGSIFRAALVTALACGTHSVALAQSTPEAGERAGLAEIIVTATRRPENLQNVPLSVSAVDAEQLASRGVVQTTDLAMVVPNLKVNSQYGDTQPNFSLRGVGVASEFNSNTASPIGVYVDEVYQAFRFTHGQQLYDLDRVEVLRGPQGTLFGRNTTGGAVSIFTRDPKLNGTNGYLTAGYGNYDRKKFEGALEFTPVEERVGVRVAFTRSEGHGFWKEKDPSTALNGATSYATSDNVGVRASLLVKPTSQFTISLKGFYAKDNPVGAPIFARGLIGGVPGTNFFGYSREADGLKYDEYHLNNTGRFYTRVTGGSLRLNYEFDGGVTLTSVTGYVKSRLDLNTDNDGSPQDIFNAHYRASTTDLNQDLRLTYSRDKIKLLFGAYYGKDTSDSTNDVRAFNVFPDATSALTFNPGGSVDPAVPPTSLNAQYHYYQRRQSSALYGESTYSLTDKLDLTGGLRYTRDKLEFLNAYSNAYTDLPGTILFPFYTPFGQSNTNSNVSGRVILNYKWAEDVRTYVSYSRGYRSGAYNGFAYAARAQVYFLQPERLDSIEAGVKSRFFDERLQLNGAVFHYNYKNQQVQEIVQAVGFLRSVSSKVNGAELEILAKPVQVLTLRGSVGYLSSRYNDNQFLSGIDIGGNQLPFASRWTGDLGGDLTIAKFSAGKIVGSAEVNYVGRYFYDSFNGKQPGFLGVLQQPGARNYLVQASYALVNAQLAFVANSFTVSGWVKNLTNKEYFPVGYDVTAAFGNTIYTAGAPRTYGLEATIKF